MKVFEVLNREIGTVTEQQVIARLKKFDWRYEFSENFVTMANGQRELELLENLVYQLWKREPDTAIRLWNEHCPQAPTDIETPPAFLFRLEMQDQN